MAELTFNIKTQICKVYAYNPTRGRKLIGEGYDFLCNFLYEINEGKYSLASIEAKLEADAERIAPNTEMVSIDVCVSVDTVTYDQIECRELEHAVVHIMSKLPDVIDFIPLVEAPEPPVPPYRSKLLACDKRRKTDWVSYIDSNLNEHEMVKGLNLAWNFEEVTDYEERERVSACESHLCVFSGMAMQSLMRTKVIEALNDGCVDFITVLSIEYAKKLCAKLDKVDLRELMNPRTEPEPEAKREVAIGEVVEFMGEHLLCVKKNDGECSGCAFLAEDDDCKFCGYCSKENRKDGKNVIFLKGGKHER